MRYDIVTKILLEADRSAILRELIGIEAEESEILEQLPGETVSIRTVDFALRLGHPGNERILLLEIQTRWEVAKIHALVEYRSRYIRLFPGNPVLPCMLLLLPHSGASGVFRDDCLTFRFRLVKLWELEAKRFLTGSPVLLPFVPLMKGGLERLPDVEQTLYNFKAPGDRRADYLSALTVLTGLKDADAARTLLGRRKDIMIESPIYDLIKEEGFQEGIKKGLEKGLHSGRVETARRMLVLGYLPEAVSEAVGLSLEELRQAGLL